MLGTLSVFHAGYMNPFLSFDVGFSLSISLVGGTIVLGGANIYVFFAFGHIFILPFSFRDPVRTIRSVSVRSFVVCIRIFMLKEFNRC